MHLCHTIKSMNLKIDFDLGDRDKVETFIARIAHAADYASPLELDKYFLRSCESRLDEIETNINSRTKGNFAAFELYDYYMCVFKKSAKLRQKYPAMIGLAEADLFTHFQLELDKDRPWLDSSPFVVDLSKKNRNLGTPFIDDSDISHWLLLCLVIRKIVNDYLIFDRPIKATDFPFEVPQWVKDHSEKEIFRLFKRKIIWE
jgi:hypothetical protein